MTEPTTQALIERLTQTNQFHENADVTTAEVVAKLETQARMWDSLNVYCGQAERQRDDAIAERDNLLERLAASQKEGLSLRAQVEAQGREIERLQVEAEQLRKGHFDVSETASVLSAELAAIDALRTQQAQKGGE